MGYQEVPHTADWALRVWAGSLPELFIEAARGMYALAGAQAEEASAPPHASGTAREFEVQGPDAEALLVGFLSELLYAQEQENLLFEDFEIQITSGEMWRLSARAQSRRLRSLIKAIKAVTFHNLTIRQTESGFETEIVFDV
ncbi:MAG: archease [Anaerolineales bacterium]